MSAEDKIPPKPSALELTLYDAQMFVALEIDYRQTGADTAETYWLLKGRDKKKSEYLRDTVKNLLDVNPNFNSIARLHRHIQEKCKVWREFEKLNAKELVEFKRLKEKFEP